jgi:hypothetical protein
MLFSLLALLQQTPAPAQQVVIAKATVQPAEAAIAIGDSVRLVAQAFDSAAARSQSAVRALVRLTATSKAA